MPLKLLGRHLICRSVESCIFGYFVRTFLSSFSNVLVIGPLSVYVCIYFCTLLWLYICIFVCSLMQVYGRGRRPTPSCWGSPHCCNNPSTCYIEGDKITHFNWPHSCQLKPYFPLHEYCLCYHMYYCLCFLQVTFLFYPPLICIHLLHVVYFFRPVRLQMNARWPVFNIIITIGRRNGLCTWEREDNNCSRWGVRRSN